MSLRIARIFWATGILIGIVIFGSGLFQVLNDYPLGAIPMFIGGVCIGVNLGLLVTSMLQSWVRK